MKFGKKLRFRAVYPWILNYINYKRLKRIIKKCVLSPTPDGTQLFNVAFREELVKVNAFFETSHRALQRDIKSVTEKTADYLSARMCTLHHLQQLQQILDAVATEISKLQDFVDVNLSGFRKITKKLKKKLKVDVSDLNTAVKRSALASRGPLSAGAALIESTLSELTTFRRHLLDQNVADTVTTSVVQLPLRDRLRKALRRASTERLAYVLQSAEMTPVAFALHGVGLLHLAAACDDALCVATLLENSVDPNGLDIVDQSPLDTAVLHGSKSVIRLLLGMDVRVAGTNLHHSNALHHAVRARNVDAVRLLMDHALSKGAGVLETMLRHTDRDGMSVAYHACARDSPEVLALLLNGAEIDASSTTPSKAACTCTRRFPEGFLSLNVGDDAAVWTCLNAASYAGSAACVALLLEFLCENCLRQCVAASSSTALHSASRSGHLSCVQLLVEGGAAVTALNAYMETPMHLACQAQQPECLRVLLSRCPPEALRARIPTSLYVCRFESNFPCGLPPPTSDVFVPLLMQAVDAESEDCVRLLLDAGATPLDETADGWSAMALALFGGQQNRNAIVAMLRSARSRQPTHPHTPPVIAVPSPTRARESDSGTAAAAAAAGAGAGAGSGAGAGAATVEGTSAVDAGAVDGSASMDSSVFTDTPGRVDASFTASTGLPGSSRSAANSDDSTATGDMSSQMRALAKPHKVQVEESFPRTSPCQQGLWTLKIQLGTVATDPGFLSHRQPAVALHTFPQTERMIRNRVSVSLTQRACSRPQTVSSHAESRAGNTGLARFLDVSGDDAVATAEAHALRRQKAASSDNSSGHGVDAGTASGGSSSLTTPTTTASTSGVVPPHMPLDVTKPAHTFSEPRSMVLTMYTAWSHRSPFTWETLPPGVNPEADSVFTFTGTDLDAFGLEVSVVPSTGAEIGRAFVSWDVLRQSAENDRELCGQMHVPIVSRSLEQVGVFNFRYLFITPYKSPPRPLHNTFSWKTTKVWGHRGTGASSTAYGIGPVGARFRRTHVAENTLLAFVTAASLGASYIEFDVHLSKDRVPVIHHDFLVKLGGGLKIPVCHLTAEQLQHITPLPSHTPTAPKLSTPVRGVSHSRDDSMVNDRGSAKKSTSHSIAALGLDVARHKQLSDHSGMLSDSYTTLEKAFKLVAASTGFNIEIKFPTEQELRDMAFKTPSRNELVDRVLDVVFRCVGSRDVMFSSFDPSICTLLACKQATYPVFMLTAAGVKQYADPRKNSIRQAIRFAKANGLFGIVSNASPLVECPRLITEIRSVGLALCTYGKINNDAETCKLQKRFGVAAVIVDHVAHISRSIIEDA